MGGPSEALVIAEAPGAELGPVRYERRDQNPALVYLATLSLGSRRTMRRALDVIAAELTRGVANAESLPWHLLRYQHTQAVRARLIERYRPANVNKHLSALRGVLKQCWRLGLMSADDSRAAGDIKSVRGRSLPPGRALAWPRLRRPVNTR